MEFLKQNLDNSLILPYDIMREIYEYADSFSGIRRQIENKEYDLDEIMYKRMKTKIQNEYLNHNRDYVVDFYGGGNYIFITHETINSPNMRNSLINGKNGYKDFYLWKHKRHTHICGLEPNFPLWYREMMIKDLKVVNPEQRYEIKSIKQLYKLWIKL